MDVQAACAATAPTTAARRRVLALAAAEARLAVRAPWIWIGVVLSAVAARSTLDADFSAGAYQGVMASITGVAIGIFVTAVQAGGRDRVLTSGAVGEGAVVDADERALARLLGQWPTIAIGGLYVAGLRAYEGSEGGFWLGDWPRRTDDATHSAVELLQGPALFVLAAAAGIAVSRATARRAVVSSIGVVVLATLGLLAWAWQWTPAVYVTAIQTQPVEITLGGAGFDATSVPSGWLLSAPDAYDASWDRVLVHLPMAGWHAVYLLGLAALAAGAAVRQRAGRLLAGVGLAAALLGVVAQVLTAPAGL